MAAAPLVRCRMPAASSCPYYHVVPLAFFAAARVKPLFRIDAQLLAPALFGAASASAAQLRGACGRWLQQPWSDISAQHLAALQKRASGRADQAFAIYTGAQR